MRVKRSVDRIPAHLRPYIVTQEADQYTPLDHAGWRYIMRIARAYFKEHAHGKYLDGLVETGIETERIPRIEDMDLCLSQFGWGAVPISGFIPPTVFLELLSLGIMPIAAEMRTLEHLDYTPAPDIVHEAAGHAPIISDPEYAEFLHECGEMARKAIITRKDMNLHEAVRALSDIKEDPTATEEQIKATEEGLKRAIAANDSVSEATQLSRFIWWTVEYGLVGDLGSPKIYGAGLLSSVGESYHCLSPSVKKIPLTLDCINQTYDITEPQPLLFVTPDFPTLTRVARELAETMAFKKGGVYGLEKAKQAESTTTATLDSGLQVSGVITSYRLDQNGAPFYLQYTGPTQLAYQEREIDGHGIATHTHGFGTPLGSLKATGRGPQHLTEQDLKKLGWVLGQPVKMEFNSGVVVEGRLQSLLPKDGRILILSFKDCTVSCGSDILFQPAWGTFDMACGESVVSVYGGAADRPRFITDLPPQQHAKQLGKGMDGEKKTLCDIYARIRKLREQPPRDTTAINEELNGLVQQLDKSFPQDWLARVDILELERRHGLEGARSKMIRQRLAAIGAQKSSVRELINRGLALLDQPTETSSAQFKREVG